MTDEDFRRLALAVPRAAESAHMGHPDFRIGKRIFATLGSPDASWAMVKLTREQQEILIAAEPAMFHPAKGAWGRQGSTLLRLDAADEATAASALKMASANVKP